VERVIWKKLLADWAGGVTGNMSGGKRPIAVCGKWLLCGSPITKLDFWIVDIAVMANSKKLSPISGDHESVVGVNE
jgi:hypothetical protein